MTVTARSELTDVEWGAGDPPPHFPNLSSAIFPHFNVTVGTEKIVKVSKYSLRNTASATIFHDCELQLLFICRFTIHDCELQLLFICRFTKL